MSTVASVVDVDFVPGGRLFVSLAVQRWAARRPHRTVGDTGVLPGGAAGGDRRRDSGRQGEKGDRKRVAEVGAVSDLIPVVRTAGHLTRR